MGWRPLLRVLGGIVLRLWCGSTFRDVTVSFFFLRCLLASAAPAERYFATQLLGMWLYSCEYFMIQFFLQPFRAFRVIVSG